MKDKIIEILENNADWVNTCISDVVFSGKFDDVANEIEKLFIEEEIVKPKATITYNPKDVKVLIGGVEVTPCKQDDIVDIFEYKPKHSMLDKMLTIHDPQYQKNTEKPKKPVCNPYARKFKRGWSKR